MLPCPLAANILQNLLEIVSSYIYALSKKQGGLEYQTHDEENAGHDLNYAIHVALGYPLDVAARVALQCNGSL